MIKKEKRYSQLGFGRPGGQKSKRSRASDVQGPCSGGCSSIGYVSTESLDSRERDCTLVLVVIAVGSDRALRSPLDVVFGGCMFCVLALWSIDDDPSTLS